MTAANPQGKGLVPVLDMLHSHLPSAIAAKPADVIVSHYLISALVLSADFKFKPVVGKPYSLYWRDGRWSLSLIAPHEWSESISGAFVGGCELREDMTWHITASDQLNDQPEVVRALSEFRDGFADSLNSDSPLEECLPFYNASLPFYQRVFASALSQSLRGSMQAAGLLAISSREWLEQVPRLGHIESSPKPDSE